LEVYDVLKKNCSGKPYKGGRETRGKETNKDVVSGQFFPGLIYTIWPWRTKVIINFPPLETKGLIFYILHL
jgi:hypothetical protein